MSENRFYVEGRVGTEPDFRKTAGGTSVCKFSFANTYSFKQGNEFSGTGKAVSLALPAR